MNVNRNSSRGWIGGMAAGMCVFIATAQEPNRELMVNYVPPSLLSSNVAPRIPEWSLPAPTRTIVAQSPKERNAVARWERFEAEFGLRDKSPSWFKGTIETTKYRLDSALFAVTDFVEHSLNFDYEVRNLGRATPAEEAPRRYRDNPWRDAMENARLKSEINLNSLTGEGFVGVKLVLPIGN